MFFSDSGAWLLAFSGPRVLKFEFSGSQVVGFSDYRILEFSDSRSADGCGLVRLKLSRHVCSQHALQQLFLLQACSAERERGFSSVQFQAGALEPGALAV